MSLIDGTTINTFVFNPEENSGESIVLTTKIFGDRDDLDDDRYITQELTLQSYGRSSSFELNFDLTPNKLRELANQLEDAMNRHDMEHP